MFFSPGETAETRSTWISRRLSGHSNCETALDECRTFDTCWPAFCQQHRPASYPRFPVEPGGFQSFMRLSLMKAAHAVTDGARCRKSGISLDPFSVLMNLKS